MAVQPKIFGKHDAKVVDQLRRCAQAGEATGAVLCADGHLGYSMPIGGVVAYPGHVSPSGVGYDIACGNKAVRTALEREDLGNELGPLADEINRRISFGMGRDNKEPVDHPVLDRIRDAPFAPQRRLLDLAAGQLGTVGAGNHYVDIFEDEHRRVWVGAHFGSRGFGHRTASGFLSLASGGRFDERADQGEMTAAPTLIPSDSELGQSYVEAMELAGAYAYAGRDLVCDKVLEILGTEAVETVHNHHNFAWREKHAGEEAWVVRKGATPAFPGQRGFVGGTMGEDSVILEGVGGPDAEEALNSTVHGAGRAMSRTKAAGKQKTVMECTVRDCGFWVSRAEFTAKGSKRGSGRQTQLTLCPRHPDGRMRKVRKRTQPGLVDWDAARAELDRKGIVLRGGAADEAPLAYKRLRDVLAAHEGTVKVVNTLRPLVVVMAGAEVFDAYKD